MIEKIADVNQHFLKYVPIVFKRQHIMKLNIFSSVHAYGIYKNRHTSEIDQEIKKVTKSKVEYVFVPHLIPTFRGMLSSIYVEPSKGVTLKRIYNELKIFYKKNYFVKILPLNRELGSEIVINTNFAIKLKK